MFDGTVAFVLVLLLSPVLLVAALLVKLSSPGPVFFVQERAGRNGATFALYKFSHDAGRAEAGSEGAGAAGSSGDHAFRVWFSAAVQRSTSCRNCSTCSRVTCR